MRQDGTAARLPFYSDARRDDDQSARGDAESHCAPATCFSPYVTAARARGAIDIDKTLIFSRPALDTVLIKMPKCLLSKKAATS